LILHAKIIERINGKMHATGALYGFPRRQKDLK